MPTKSKKAARYEDACDMMGLLKKIGPLPRTLACDATDRALKILAKEVPGAKIEGYPTGSKAWSWTVPQRWELRSATIKTRSGRVLVDAKDHHLHCVNYSQPFKGRVSREELFQHLHSYPKRPDAIPFMFHFYDKNWGFCIPHSWRSRFQDAEYDVEIDSSFEDGDLNMLSAILPGKLKETFILCADICHPTQANDSLTGLVAAVDIFKRLAKRKERKYSYALVVIPETIGSIAFFSRHPELIERSVGGFFSEMLGTDGPLVLQASRRGDQYWDTVFEQALAASGLPHRRTAFLKNAANDERCIDAPGVDIPMPSLTRYPFAEYHSSDDNVGLIDLARLREGRDLLQSFVDMIEEDYLPVLNQPGPIFLSGHGLHPDWRKDPSLLPIMESFLDVMYNLNGKYSVHQMAKQIGRTPAQVRYWTDAFASKGLLTKNEFHVKREDVLP